MRILFLAHLFPLPLDSGGKIKSYHTLKALAAENEVHLLSYVRAEDEPHHIQALQGICESVNVIPLSRNKLTQFFSIASSMVFEESFIISRDFTSGMQNAFYNLINQINPDVVHIDHLQMAQFPDFHNSYKTVLDHHNVESAIIKRVADTTDSLKMKLGAKLEWPKLQRYELATCRHCDMVLTVSEEDKTTLQKLDPTACNIYSVPIGVDTEYFHHIKREPDSKSILSIGTMYWPPNIDSMLYFCSDILPLIKKDTPECTLIIAGQRPVPAIQALASDSSIRVTGYVDDVCEIARDCGVFIVPLRSGSGVRVKILNAMAMGLPIVATSIGAEGLEITNGEHLLIADKPSDFAQAVMSVLNDASFANQLGQNARQLVCEKYSWETIGKHLLSIYGRLEQ